MVVSLLSIVVELPDLLSLKDKRRIVHSVRDRTIRKFKISVAEVDLQESLTFSQLGAALVSNDKLYGERVMHKVLQFVEDLLPGRVHDVSIYTEIFD